MQWRGWERGLRGLLNWGVLITLILCFLPIVTLLQQLINLEQYAARKDTLGKIAKGILDVPLIGGTPLPLYGSGHTKGLHPPGVGAACTAPVVANSVIDAWAVSFDGVFVQQQP